MHEAKAGITLRRVELTLHGEALSLSVFPSVKSAVRHLEDHFFQPDEGWRTLLPRLGLRAEEIGFPKEETEPPCPNERLDLVLAYEAYARLIEEALRFGACFPMHLHLVQRHARSKGAHPGFCFVSLDGVVVYVANGAVRSAMRPARFRNHSTFSRFISSCDFALARAERGSYMDTKYRRRWFAALERRCTDEHWALAYWNRPRYEQIRNRYL